MANRTLQFYGYAYGDVPVQLNAHINGQLVFSGSVATLNEVMPDPSVDMNSAPVLFSVTESALYPTSYSGSYPMTISVATGYGIAVRETSCNYMFSSQGAGTADVFVPCFNGIPANSEGTPDSRSNVQLNGVQQVPPAQPSAGQWTWLVDTGSTLECNFNVSEGSEVSE